MKERTEIDAIIAIWAEPYIESKDFWPTSVDRKNACYALFDVLVVEGYSAEEIKYIRDKFVRCVVGPFHKKGRKGLEQWRKEASKDFLTAYYVHFTPKTTKSVEEQGCVLAPELTEAPLEFKDEIPDEVIEEKEEIKNNDISEVSKPTNDEDRIFPPLDLSMFKDFKTTPIEDLEVWKAKRGLK